MRTIAEIINSCKDGDMLVAGFRKWEVKYDTTYPEYIIAHPANKKTRFELWNYGIEKVAFIPGLKRVKKND